MGQKQLDRDCLPDDVYQYIKLYPLLRVMLRLELATIIISAKLSDIFGRKPALVIAVCIFTIFSGACGASQSLIEL